MGFNKRFLTEDLIIRTPNERLGTLFNADALIMDTWSAKFYELYSAGLDKYEILLIFQ